MNKNILKNRKAILSAALVIAATASAFAQGNGIAGINEATSMVAAVGILAKAFAEDRPARSARPKASSPRPVSGSYDATEPKAGVSRQKINDLYRNDAGASRYGQSVPGESVAEEEEEFEPKKAKKQKGSRGPGFFSKIKEKMINMFDEEIDDNEI